MSRPSRRRACCARRAEGAAWPIGAEPQPRARARVARPEAATTQLPDSPPPPHIQTWSTSDRALRRRPVRPALSARPREPAARPAQPFVPNGSVSATRSPPVRSEGRGMHPRPRSAYRRRTAAEPPPDRRSTADHRPAGHRLHHTIDRSSIPDLPPTSTLSQPNIRIDPKSRPRADTRPTPGPSQLDLASPQLDLASTERLSIAGRPGDARATAIARRESERHRGTHEWRAMGARATLEQRLTIARVMPERRPLANLIPEVHLFNPNLALNRTNVGRHGPTCWTASRTCAWAWFRMDC